MYPQTLHNYRTGTRQHPQLPRIGYAAFAAYPAMAPLPALHLFAGAVTRPVGVQVRWRGYCLYCRRRLTGI